VQRSERLRKDLKWRLIVVGELVLADHVSHFDPCNGCGGMECLEAHHRLGDPLDKPVVVFKDIVEIFDLADFNDLAVPLIFRIVLTACSPARLTPLLSMTTFSGTPSVTITFLKNRREAARSRRSYNMKSRVWP